MSFRRSFHFCILFGMLLSPVLAKAETPVKSFQLQHNGLNYEVTQGELNTDSDFDEASTGLAAEIQTIKEEDPKAEFHLEVASIDIDEGRSAASNGVSGLISSVVGKLKSKKISPEQSREITLPKQNTPAFKSFFRGRSKAFYALVRFAVPGVIETVLLIAVKGYSPIWFEVAAETGITLFITGFFSDKMSDATNQFRISQTRPVRAAVNATRKTYEVAEQGIKKLMGMEGPTVVDNSLKWLNAKVFTQKSEGLFNFFVLDLMLARLLTGVEQLTNYVNGTPYHSPLHWWALPLGALGSTLSQGVFDQAIYYYNLWQTRRGTQSAQAILSDRMALMAIDSSAAVIGMMLVTMDLGLSASVSGGIILAALGAGGFTFRHQMIKKLASLRVLSGLGEAALTLKCDHDAGGTLGIDSGIPLTE